MRTRPRGGNARKLKADTNPTYFEYPPHSASDSDSSCGRIIYTKHDHKQIAPGKYLNDTIISFFMQYHYDHQVPEDLKQRIHVFNSFFFQKIKTIRQNNSSYVHASKWLGSINIFDKDFLIMPVCEKDHWVLVIVCYPANCPKPKSNLIPDEQLYEPAVMILNSCVGLAPSIKKPLSQFLKFQWLKERKVERSVSIHNAKSNGIRLIFPDLPQQRNSTDCGIYILGFFYSFLRNPRRAYIKMFRRHSMKTWFKDNGLDISRERRRMLQVVNGQIAAWSKIDRSETINLELESQEVQISSPNSSVDMVEDNPIVTGGDHSVIVIR